MKILVLATDYTDLKGNVASHFIHTRNLIYSKEGIDVIVLSFSTKENYIIEGIQVISLNHYLNNKEIYDVLISHAPNIRNHYRFLKREKNKFKNIFYYFHGHEVLKTNEIYPEPYPYIKRKNLLDNVVINSYDVFKLKIWRNYFKKIGRNEHLIFVSEWMKKQFEKYTKINLEKSQIRYSIIYNCIGSIFEENNYDDKCDKEFDFITIRNILDNSKYAIDKVVKIANRNPKYSFLVIGKGDFFKFNKIPNNMKWIDANLTHNEIISYLDKSRFALLPTRADAQGVMACEMASYGIPLITSNIEVNKEILKGFNNVQLIDNNEEVIVESIFKARNIGDNENRAFYRENTVMKEIDLIRNR